MVDNFAGKLPDELRSAILTQTRVSFDTKTSQIVKGYEFGDKTVNFDEMLSSSFLTTGFQATSFGLAVQEINKMIRCKVEGTLTEDEIEKQKSNPILRKPTPCTIFLGYTSNLISAGTRETLNYLAKYNMVDVLVTTAGGIEEDIIKCLAPTYIGRFDLPGAQLYADSINRIGNLLEPNTNYCLFEDWLVPLLDKMLQEEKEGFRWTPSKFIHRLGKEINNPESVYFWAYKNNIPVFCPALTDGSIGDMLFFHTFKNDGRSITLDIVEDIRLLNLQSLKAAKSGMIILGGGVTKHHICNANLMRNGADFSVFVNTASEYDGSDSGAQPDEAISWGKIKTTATPVKMHADASFAFPLIVSQTFFKFKEHFVKPDEPECKVPKK